MDIAASPPTRQRASVGVRKIVVAGSIAIAVYFICLIPRWMPASAGAAVQATDHLFYDLYYQCRPVEDQTNGPVVIVAADQDSLRDIDQTLHYGWPWPRELWGNVVTYCSNAGAKAVVFDLIFTESSVYNNSSGDDDAFAAAIKASKIPVVFGSYVNTDGKFEHFAPPIADANLAGVNAGSGKLLRDYRTVINGKDSLALASVKSAHQPVLVTDDQFLLHYYGPNQTASGVRTFQYIGASKVMDALMHGKPAEQRLGISPALFKDKIVLLGTITVGTYDLKASPLSTVYPGVEFQATAVTNVLRGQQVKPLSSSVLILLPLLFAIAASFGVVLPRKAMLKLLVPLVMLVLLFTVGVGLFRRADIRWMPPAESLLALLLATPAAFAYTYFAEDRQRRFMLKALSKVVSPAVAEQLAKDPQRLALGTVRTDLTVVFTDLANFTDLSESMDVQTLGELLNKYLGAMSDQVLLNNGTLDKYIGDAVMCFWNAPLPQQDHAVLACRTALAMARREAEIKAELREVGQKLFTRIGINTTSAAVGFVGSSHLFNYTALGDGINLASRLEGANKLYGTRILVSETTAELVRSSFLLRKIDSLRVKGKTRPVAVYELIAEKNSEAISSALLPRVERYEAALKAYQSQNWDLAERIWLEVCRSFGEDSGEDKASRAMLARVKVFRQSPPAEDWDGTYDAKEK